MNCIYIANMLDEETYQTVFEPSDRPTLAANKYHTLLCQGLSAAGAKVFAFSILPVNRQNCKKRIIRAYSVSASGICFEYPVIVLVPAVKQFLLLVQAFFRTLFAPSNTVVLYDGLVIAASYGACLAAKLRGFKRLCIATDLPDFFTSKSERSVRINKYVMNCCSGYLFLTQQMNGLTNSDQKPYLVIEGHVDRCLQERPHAKYNSRQKKIIYAGSCAVKYGIKNLCQAFQQIAEQGEELHIYGGGDYALELQRMASIDARMIYHGTCLNSEVVDAELSATLLVNPRPATDEYTKYSFPSKTMEYMASGTPVAMTRLPGMPEEYCEYVYLFDSASTEDIAKKLREILDKPSEELEAFGARAKRFVMENKTNVKQAEKILRFIEEEL